MWEPSQATSDKDINGLVLLASAGCRLFGERMHRETVYVLCGGKGTAPGAPYMGAQRYQACDFIRGGKLVVKPQVPQNRSLTPTQVLLLQSLWTPVEAPNSSNGHTPWPKDCEPAASSPCSKRSNDD